MPEIIVNAILEGLKKLFIPDSENINQNVDSIQSKFEFIFKIETLFKDTFSYLTSNQEKIPVITMNLGSARGKYNYGSNAKALDMTWYEEYKPTIDLVIIAFCYIAFIFNVYKRLPDIIAGSGAITMTSDKIYQEVAHRKTEKES